MDIAFRIPKPAAVEVRDLQVQLGGTPVLRGVNLRIEAGRMVALIGPNGSGKTTLLRCLLGLQEPHSGSVRLLQEDHRIRRSFDELATYPNACNSTRASC